MSGDRQSDDSKVCAKKIKIGAEIGIPGLVKAQIEDVKKHTTSEHTDSKAATAGNRGAATAGDYGAATSMGMSAAGKNGIASARGCSAKVRGGMGAILVCALEGDSCVIRTWTAGVVDGDKIKPDTWYTVKDGEFVEVPEGCENND